MKFRSAPERSECFPKEVERISSNSMRCSSGDAARGKALVSPYPERREMLTAGPGELVPSVSRSRDHWKRTSFAMVGRIAVLHVPTRKRLWKSAVPFEVTEPLLDC